MAWKTRDQRVGGVDVTLLNVSHVFYQSRLWKLRPEDANGTGCNVVQKDSIVGAAETDLKSASSAK
ncbi:hypothetical protein OS035_01375 [Rhizobium sp. 268]